MQNPTWAVKNSKEEKVNQTIIRQENIVLLFLIKHRLKSVAKNNFIFWCTKSKFPIDQNTDGRGSTGNEVYLY